MFDSIEVNDIIFVIFLSLFISAIVILTFNVNQLLEMVSNFMFIFVVSLLIYIFLKNKNYSNSKLTQKNIMLGVTLFIVLIMGFTAISKIVDKKKSADGYISFIGFIIFGLVVFCFININTIMNKVYNL